MKNVPIFFVFLLLLSCSSQQTVSSTRNTQTSPTLQILPSKTTIPSTSTNTPEPSSTPTLVPSPTWTPLSTIDAVGGLQTYYEWLEGTSNCHLPCWAGILPGNTTWDETKHILQPLAGLTILELRLDKPCTFGQCNYITWVFPSDLNTLGNVYSEVEHNTVHLIQLQIVDSHLLKALSLQNIFNQYGKPAILLFSAEPDLPGDLFLELILVYPDSQFVVKYSKYAKLSDNKVVSCGQDSAIELIVLDNKEQLMSVDTIADAVETSHLNVKVWHKPVEEATGMTIDTFYETFRKPNAPCITTPISVWRP